MAQAGVGHEDATPETKTSNVGRTLGESSRKVQSRGSVKRLVAAGFSVDKDKTQKAFDTVGVAQERVHGNEQQQLRLQARAALKDGLSKVLASVDDFDAAAASAFGAFKRGLQLCAELPADGATTLVAEVEEKRRVLEFLCRLAREKRMYCKQVQSVLDILLKNELWHDTWQKSDDLRARVPANLRSSYDGQEEL